MVEIIWNIIQIAAIGIMWVASEPTNLLRHWIFKTIYKCKPYDNNFVWRLLDCAICSTFWIYILYKLLWFNDIQIGEASIAAIIAEIIDRKLKRGNV